MAEKKKKVQTKIELSHEQMQCILCKLSHVTSHIINMQSIDQFIICNGCLKNFIDSTKHLG